MPTPDIDNEPELIDKPDAIAASDVSPVPSPDAALETITVGNDNPAVQIEAKSVNLIEVFNRLQNLAADDFFAIDTTDNPVIAEQKAYFKDALKIDVEADSLISAFAKIYCLDRFKALDSDSLDAVYTIPDSTIANIDLRGKPQLDLYFVEVNYLTSLGREIVDGQIAGIRLMESSSQTLTESELVLLGEKIKDSFRDFLWVKGKNMLSYSDPDKGLNLQVLCQSKEGGIEVINKVLALRNFEIQNSRLNYKVNESPAEAYPVTPTLTEVLGKTVKSRLKRPEVSVKLRAAFLHIDGLVKPKVIYDNSGKYKNAYVSNSP